MKKTEREEYLYHNTEKLLKKYRDIVWNVEVATMQCEEDFKKEMDCSIEEFLDMPYKVMEDLNGSAIEKQEKLLVLKYILPLEFLVLFTTHVGLKEQRL